MEGLGTVCRIALHRLTRYETIVHTLLILALTPSAHGKILPNK